MGTGICSRRQKGLLQTGFCLLAVVCLGAGGLLYSHLQEKVKNAEALSLKYKQQQDALSAQLQVVYEHRSRLERSLQKERGEHKKTKEDFLVYKLEAQEALNKEKQDSMNRYGALSSQHKILKNQHEDVKKQLQDLQLLHNSLKLEHRKVTETHNQKYSQLQREKDNEINTLQDSVFKLREESKLLRKAHQEVHSHLLSAQAQVEEFRQLKEALQKMPSFKEVGAIKENQDTGQLASLDNKQSQLANPKVQNLQGKTPEDDPDATDRLLSQKPQHLITKDLIPNSHTTGNKPAYPQSWEDVVNKVNSRLEKEREGLNKNQQSNFLGASQNQELLHTDQLASHRGKRLGLELANREADNKEAMDKEELEMDAGMIDREENPPLGKEHIAQEPMIPDVDGDPAQDPNNQGEDEFEEAELERPDFEERVAGPDKIKEVNKPVNEELNGKLKDAGNPDKAGEDTVDEYQEDQDQESEDHGGEVDDNEDLELVQDEPNRGHVDAAGADGNKEEDY